VSIDAIAKAVGVSPPSIYLHFADKHELMVEVSKGAFGGLRERLEAAATRERPSQALYAMGEAYVQFGLDRPEAYRILFMQPRRRQVDPSYTSLVFEGFVSVVRASIEEGALQPGDPRDIAIALWTSVHGITSLLIADPDFAWPSDMARKVLEQLGRGVFNRSRTNP